MTTKIFNLINHEEKRINYTYEFDLSNETSKKVIENYEFIFINNFLKSKNPIDILEQSNFKLNHYDYIILKNNYYTIVRFLKA